MLSGCRVMAFVPTRDAARARRFYEETLRLTFEKDDGFAMMFDSNGVKIRIAKVGDYTPAPFTILGWQVADIAREHRELAARGVAFEQFGLPGQDAGGIWASPSGDRVAWFKDPDGNVLSISQHE